MRTRRKPLGASPLPADPPTRVQLVGTGREVLAMVELGPVPSGRGRPPALRSSATREARILRSLSDQDDGANQRGTLNGRPDETSFLSGVEASNGQAGKSAQHGQ
jgi:hypothetical protein